MGFGNLDQVDLPALGTHQGQAQALHCNLDGLQNYFSRNLFHLVQLVRNSAVGCSLFHLAAGGTFGSFLVVVGRCCNFLAVEGCPGNFLAVVGLSGNFLVVEGCPESCGFCRSLTVCYNVQVVLLELFYHSRIYLLHTPSSLGIDMNQAR